MTSHLACRPTGKPLSLTILAVATLIGCDSGRIDLCFVDDDDAVQVSPSGRAVAFVDPESYQSILNAPPSARPGLDCVVNEFTARFDGEPEAVVFALDFENGLVTRARMMRERGFDWFEDVSALADDEFLRWKAVYMEVSDIVQALPDQPPSALNATARRPEQGVGDAPVCFCLPNGPPFHRGWVFLPTKEDLVAGRFMHEFAHFWGAHLKGPPALKTQNDRYDGHWGFSSVGGLLGGWDPESFESVGDGVYRARVAPTGRPSNRSAYAPLELYLMGLVGAEAVPPIQVAVGAIDLGEADDGRWMFSAQRIETVTIGDIIAWNGQRRPSAEESRKVFSVALVVLADHKMSDAEWDFYERAMDFLEADADRRLADFFPVDDYPGQHDFWELLTSRTGDPFLNFSATTSGHGSLRFEVGRKKWFLGRICG
jgi:hypothetical protein